MISFIRNIADKDALALRFQGCQVESDIFETLMQKSEERTDNAMRKIQHDETTIHKIG